MSQKEVQKKREFFIEEDKDFYLAFLNKKLRNANKKLEQIEELLKRDKSTLKAEQLKKVNSKADVLLNIKQTEELKETYYLAYKTAIEEGKVPNPERSMENEKDNEPSKAGKSAENVPVVVENDSQSKEEIVRETLKKVLNLISFSQIFGNIAAREEFSKTCEQVNREEIPRVDELQQFYKSVFNFTENPESIPIGDRFNNSLDKLTQFVNAEDKTAFNDKTYKKLEEIVEKTVNTASFKQSTLNIENLQKTVVQHVAQEQPKAEEKPHVQEEPKKEKVPEPTIEEVEVELPPGAAFLKPDIDEGSKSPEKGRFLPKEPKLIKFVDEIERELQSAQKAQNMQSPQSKEEGDSASKEVVEQDGKVEVEGNENSGEKTEQKSFRKRKYNNNEYGQNKGKYNNENNGNGKKYQNNRGYDNQKRPNSNYKENKYGNGNQRGYGKGSYGVQYVEKKPQQNED